METIQLLDAKQFLLLPFAQNGMKPDTISREMDSPASAWAIRYH
jgi:hypothetical protein